MKKNTIFSLFVFISILVSVVSVAGVNRGEGTRAAGNPVAVMNTSKGTIKIELYEDDAPITVENFINYVEDGFYDGLIFHRVIEGFMIQGGGFNPDMTQKTPTYPSIKNEAAISQHRNKRGTIAMARTNQGPDTATSQFFINHADNDFLDWDKAQDGYGYCVFGEVTEGMSVVDNIAGVETTTMGGYEDVPVEDVLVNSVTMGSDTDSNGDGNSDGGDDSTDDGSDSSSSTSSSSFLVDNFLLIEIIVSVIVAVGIIFVLSRKKDKEED